MRIRQGFVSNSSSSSFICEVSGRTEAGYDLSLDEVNMYCCVNDHYFDENFLLEQPDDTGKDDDLYAQRIGLDGDYDGNGDEYDEEDEDFRYEVPANRCPICTLTKLRDSDILKYVINKKLNVSKEDLSNEIRQKYGNLKNLKKEI